MSAGGIRAGAAYVELGVRKKVTGPLRQVQGRLKAFAGGVSGIGRNLLGASTALAVPIGFAAKTYADFADQMSVVRAVSGATEAEFAKLNERAKELGRTTSFTASEVAGAQAALGRAGFKPAEIDDSIASVLDLARATSTDLPQAADIAGAALRGFGLDTSESARVADVLTATANGSAQTLTDLHESLKLVAPLARQTGMSIEDTGAALAVLANNGLKGSIAGNSVGRALKNLSNERIAGKLLEKTGVQAHDAAGNLRPLAEILQEVGKATADMGSAEKVSVFEEIFGRGQLAALNLASDDSVFQIADNLRDAGGQAAATAKQMDDNLGGAFRMLTSAVEGVQIAIGEALQGELRGFMDQAATIAGRITEWIMANRGLVGSALKIVAVVAGVGAALIAVGTVAGGVAFAIGGLVSIITFAIGIVQAIAAVLAFLVSPVGLVIAAIVALGYVILRYTSVGGQALGWLSAQFQSLLAFVQPIIDGIKDALATGDIGLAAQILWKGIQVAFRVGMLKVQGLWQGFKTAVLDTFDAMIVGIRQKWNNASTFLARGLLKLQGLIDKSFDADQAIAFLEQDASRFNRRVEDEAAGRMDERAKAEAAAIKAAEEDLAKAQEELTALTKQASDQRAAIESGTAPPVLPPDEIPTVKIPDFTNLGKQLDLATGTAQGTFSSAAAGLLGQAGGAAERTADAAERTAEGVEELLDRGLTFG